MNIIHTPAGDGSLEITTVQILFCPNCGKPISRYSITDPAPTINRAVTNNTPCNDNSCKYNVANATGTLKCAFRMRNIGCYRVDSVAVDAVNANHSAMLDLETANLYITVD